MDSLNLDAKRISVAISCSVIVHLPWSVSECLASKTVSSMQGGQKAFSYVAIFFSHLFDVLSVLSGLDSASLNMENRWVCLAFCLYVS